jgi:uncharacterized protein
MNEGNTLTASGARHAIVLFGRYPELGRTKTRLAQSLGDMQTLLFYQALLADAAWKVGGLPSCDAIAALAATAPFTAPPSDPLGRRPFAGTHLTGQNGADFGARLTNAFCDTFDKGYQRVVLIGTDTPELEVADLARAFELLEEFPVVMGPALDGGYYLVAANRPRPQLFSGITWSTATVLEETVAAASALSLEVGYVRRLGDVDYLGDLLRLRRRREEALLTGAPSPCLATDAWFEGSLPGQEGTPPPLHELED